ncbi:MAG: hypothetical protein H6861_04955 [Rhodospirillales bacterium]|nr:hypothetical protein [Rhodospirillales bacterium]
MPLDEQLSTYANKICAEINEQQKNGQCPKAKISTYDIFSNEVGLKVVWGRDHVPFALLAHQENGPWRARYIGPNLKTIKSGFASLTPGVANQMSKKFIQSFSHACHALRNGETLPILQVGELTAKEPA